MFHVRAARPALGSKDLSFLHLFGACSWLAFTHATRIKKNCLDTKLDPDILTLRMYLELHIIEYIN